MIQKKSNKKTYRHRYFSIEIKAGVQGSQVSQLFDSHSSVLEVFRKTEFPTQKLLDTILPDLVIQEENPKIVLLEFIGQLEGRMKGNLPYWKISVETSSPTTAISLARAISQRLFSTTDSDLGIPKNSIDSRIKVRSREDLERLQPELHFLIPSSDWSPGYLNPRLSVLLDSMEDSQISEEILLEIIHERPKARTILLHVGKAIMAENDIKAKELREA